MSKANESSKPSENRFLEVLRIAKAIKAQQKAEQKPLTIDWLPRREPHFATMSTVINGRSSEEE